MQRCRAVSIFFSYDQEVADLERFVASVWNDLPKVAEKDPRLFRSVDVELSEIWQAYNDLFAANNPKSDLTSPIESTDTCRFTHTRKRPNRTSRPRPNLLSSSRSRAKLYASIIVFFIAMLLGAWKIETVRMQLLNIFRKAQNCVPSEALNILQVEIPTTSSYKSHGVERPRPLFESSKDGTTQALYESSHM